MNSYHFNCAAAVVVGSTVSSVGAGSYGGSVGDASVAAAGHEKRLWREIG